MTEILLKNGSPGAQPSGREQESLYERFPWPYAFCRNHLFRDDTEKIVAALWPAGIPSRAESLLEVGCGPGFYARGLAARFEHLRVTGIDLSARQLHRARSAARQLANCSFEKGDVLALGRAEASVDAVVASRLFMILSEREQALSEAHRVLRPGGRCFVAEPRSALRAAVPLRVMWLLAGLSTFSGKQSQEDYREPDVTSVLAADEFRTLIESQPWRDALCWQDGWYQYAICEKDSGIDSSRPKQASIIREGP